MNQANSDLYLTQEEHQIIIGSHARTRIAERLSWSKAEYKQAIAETCLEFWDEIISKETKWFQIVNKGVRWIFETRGMNRVVLMTVIPYHEHPVHEELRELIRIFCSTGKECRRKKLQQEINRLNKEAPKMAMCRDNEDRMSYFFFDTS